MIGQFRNQATYEIFNSKYGFCLVLIFFIHIIWVENFHLTYISHIFLKTFSRRLAKTCASTLYLPPVSLRGQFTGNLQNPRQTLPTAVEAYSIQKPSRDEIGKTFYDLFIVNWSRRTSSNRVHQLSSAPTGKVLVTVLRTFLV